MLLAELEIWHTRPITPTRRVALGHLVLPTDPAPGLGGVLLAAVVAAYLPDVDDELVPDLGRLIDQVTRGERVVQPRLQHRYQVDRHGMAVSVHQLNGDADNVTYIPAPVMKIAGSTDGVAMLEPTMPKDEIMRHRLPKPLPTSISRHGPAGTRYCRHGVSS